MRFDTLSVVGISGSPSAHSKSRVLLQYALSCLAAEGVETRQIDLNGLPADALLGRSRSPEMDEAIQQVLAAEIIVVSTPVYRATYSGLLKVFFDLLPPNSLRGKVGIPVATGGAAGHQLVLDHGLRPLFASVGATVVPTGTYGTDTQFPEGAPHPSLLARIDRAVAEAIALASVRQQAASRLTVEV